MDDINCPIVYSCVLPSVGPDLCAVGNLDTSTGVFELATSDKVTYPPGAYVVDIEGAIYLHPTVSNIYTFIYELIDLCETATISVDSSLMFEQLEYSY